MGDSGNDLVWIGSSPIHRFRVSDATAVPDTALVTGTASVTGMGSVGSVGTPGADWYRCPVTMGRNSTSKLQDPDFQIFSVLLTNGLTIPVCSVLKTLGI